MKTFLVTLLTFITIHSYCRQSDSGKMAFKEAVKLDSPDFSIAYRILKKEVKADPNNTEARYFLGYCIDRINSAHGAVMNLVKKQLTIEASEQFEAIIKLQPKYQGEIFVLDPYGKLTSVWGALAQSYLSKGLKDSATWAFREGKRRGGFIKPMLEYNRQLLNSCSNNAILLTIGDNVTFPCWYLQHIENVRTDITVLDANLVGTDWYPKYLRKENKIKLSLTDTQLDTTLYQEWTKQTVTITNPKDSSMQLSWTMPPVYNEKYIVRADIVILDLLRTNYFKRDFYFTTRTDSSNNLFLEPNFKNEGLVDKVMPAKMQDDDLLFPSKNLKDYNIDNLTASEIQNSTDVLLLLNEYRYAYAVPIRQLFNQGRMKEAKHLAEQMRQKFDIDKLPYNHDNTRQYFEMIFRILRVNE